MQEEIKRMTDYYRVCPKCKNKIEPGDVFCASCGERITYGKKKSNSSDETQELTANYDWFKKENQLVE